MYMHHLIKLHKYGKKKKVCFGSFNETNFQPTFFFFFFNILLNGIFPPEENINSYDN